jgi:transposase-like protein
LGGIVRTDALKLWMVLQKVCRSKKLTIKRISCIFVNEHTNNTSLPRLPEHEDKKNGKKTSHKQNYLCKNCGRQFIGDHALSGKQWLRFTSNSEDYKVFKYYIRLEYAGNISYMSIKN